MLFNSHVLMSDARHFSVDQPINPYYNQDPLDQAKAIAEHDAIKTTLIYAGVKVTTVASPTDSQDGVYTANWALIRGTTAVMARLPNVRQSEEAVAAGYLRQMGFTIVTVPDGLKFSGQGDALPCGSLLFCGSSYRSDAEAQDFAAKTLGFERVQLETIPQRDDTGNPVINPISGWADSFFYDIDLALAVIRPVTDTEKGLIAYCPEAFTPDSQQRLAALTDVDSIHISLEEAQHAFASNLVSTGETVVMSAHAPELKAALEDRGIRVLTPEVSELAKGGGYIRCTTLTIS